MQNPSPQQFGIADLADTITASPNPVKIRKRLTLPTIVNNAGSSTATGVMFQKTLPPFITLVSVISSQGLCMVAGELITCAIGSMPPGSTEDVGGSLCFKVIMPMVVM